MSDLKCLDGLREDMLRELELLQMSDEERDDELIERIARGGDLTSADTNRRKVEQTMTENYMVLCFKTHGYYKAGTVYSCKHQLINSDFYQIYYEGSSNMYATKDSTYCNLSYFIKVEEEFNLKFYKRRFLATLLNKIFKLKLVEFRDARKAYSLVGLSTDTKIEVYMSVLYPIAHTYYSDYYIHHQEKFDYILQNIMTMKDMTDRIDIVDRLKRFNKLIEAIAESMKHQEAKAQAEAEGLIVPMVNDFIEKQDALIQGWMDCVEEVWND